MLSKIMGMIWMLLGLLWLAKPEMLKNRLKKKTTRKVKRIVLGFVLVFSFTLIGSVIKAHGLLPKVIGIIGMIVTIKAIMLITSKTSEKMLEWWADKPVGAFRVGAGIVFSIGVMLMFVN